MISEKIKKSLVLVSISEYTASPLSYFDRRMSNALSPYVTSRDSCKSWWCPKLFEDHIDLAIVKKSKICTRRNSSFKKNQRFHRKKLTSYVQICNPLRIKNCFGPYQRTY